MLKRALYVAISVLLASAPSWAQAAQDAPAAPAAQGARGGGRGRGAGPPPRIMTFEARPQSIKPGESVVLVWSTENPAGPAIERGASSMVVAKATTPPA